MDELSQITEYIQEQAGEDAEVIFGHGVDPNLRDCIRVTVIATGFAHEGKVVKKAEEKKVHELDRSQIHLFEAADNSVNHGNQEIALKIAEQNPDKDKPVLKTPEDKPILKPEEKILYEKPEKNEEEQTERGYSFTLFNSDDAKTEMNDEGEEGLFRNEEDEFGVGKEISADQIINEEGLMEYRKTKERLEQQASLRREKLKTNKKSEMTKEEFNEKWTLPAYLRRGVKMDNIPHSSEPYISRYNLNDDNNLLGNNKFLHDNVD